MDDPPLNNQQIKDLSHPQDRQKQKPQNEHGGYVMLSVLCLRFRPRQLTCECDTHINLLEIRLEFFG